jgi:hypothetical protein
MDSNNLTTPNTDITQRQAAIIAAIGFLITIAAVFYGSYFVFSKIIVPEDAISTSRNIVANEGLFRTGIMSWLLLLIGDILRAWAFYVFFKHVNKSLSSLAAWFMLIHVAIFGITQLNLIFASEILHSADYLTVIESNQLQALSLFFINGHNYGFQIGLFFFSFHLLTLGILIFKSGYIPKMLGVLLIISFLSYLIDSSGRILFSGYPYFMFKIFFIPMLVGELSLIVWLVLKGGRLSVIQSKN